MKNKSSILFILLGLGILMIGGGIWWLLNAPGEKVNIPEGEPVIYEKIDQRMMGEFTYLYIYPDGSILNVEEKGLRFPRPGHPATRTWKTGKLTAEQLDHLLNYFRNSGLDKLEGKYQFPGKPIEGGPSGGLTSSDMGFTIYVNSEHMVKAVTAYGYLTPDGGETYPDMPSPLNEIFIRLRLFAMATEQVRQENISP